MFYKKIIAIMGISLMFSSVAVWAEEAAPSKGDVKAQQMAIYKADIARIEHYLNNLTTVAAAFQQSAPDGSVSQGMFYLSRPGKLRWEYDPPTPITIIAKGSILTYYDKELEQVSHVPLDDSMAGILTQEHITLEGEGTQIRRYEKAGGKISISLINRDKENEGMLTLVFSDAPLKLAQMEVLDATGEKTQIDFTSTTFGVSLEKSLFDLPKLQRKR